MIHRKQPPLRVRVLCSPHDISKITSKPEWYLENNYHSEWYFSILLIVFLKNNLTNRMILRKYPPHLMTVLYSPYDIWKLTSKPEWHIENNTPVRMTVLYSPYYIWKITSKPEWYLENNYQSEWHFSVLLIVFLKNNLTNRMILRK